MRTLVPEVTNITLENNIYVNVFGTTHHEPYECTKYKCKLFHSIHYFMDLHELLIDTFSSGLNSMTIVKLNSHQKCEYTSEQYSKVHNIRSSGHISLVYMDTL